MNLLRFIAIVMSVGMLSQYAAAAERPAYGTSMTAEQLAYNNCTEGYIQGGCENPVDWDDFTECKSWMQTYSCTRCKPGYELMPYTCIPNNATVRYYPGCDPEQLTDDQRVNATFAYTCRCSSLYSETGVNGFLYTGCSIASIEFKCDTSEKYYKTQTKPTCTVTTDANGNFVFTKCKGCSLCNEDRTTWETPAGTSSSNGVQRAYKNVFNANGENSTCVKTAQSQWRCAPGYYGTATNDTSGCTACPTLASSGLTPVCNDSDEYCPAVSSPAGSTKITGCYATTHAPDLSVYLKDGAGTFHWVDGTNSGNCNYQ